MAATRLAVREARRRTSLSAPLHLVGFSNGGALALKYALDSIRDPQLARPDRLVLISPMIGITRYARFVGFAGLPAILPRFAKAAWLSIVPEFNPFKYNSFPINGARQSYRLTQALQQQLATYSRSGELDRLPPALTFQSVMDFTVSTPALVSAFYALLPANGSELVLFDVNRTVKFGPLLRASADTAVTRLLPSKALPTALTTIITNVDSDNGEEIERLTEAGELTERARPLAMTYPPGLFSLSHVALPFPMNDSLYGLAPESTEFGINLGALAPRGERDVLIASLDSLLRVASNPFFPYVRARIEEEIDGRVAPKPTTAVAPTPEPALIEPNPGWTFSDLLSFLNSFWSQQSDPAAAPP